MIHPTLKDWLDYKRTYHSVRGVIRINKMLKQAKSQSKKINLNKALNKLK